MATTSTIARSLLRHAAATKKPHTTTTRAFAAAAESSENLVKTALNDLHKDLGGDMVPFAGYELPVLYKGTENGGVMKEHLWCRSDGKAALFDVSHMGQVCVYICVCVEVFLCVFKSCIGEFLLEKALVKDLRGQNS